MATKSTPTASPMAAVRAALERALPYVASCEHSTDFKAGVVGQHLSQVRAALSGTSGEDMVEALYLALPYVTDAEVMPGCNHAKARRDAASIGAALAGASECAGAVLA